MHVKSLKERQINLTVTRNLINRSAPHIYGGAVIIIVCYRICNVGEYMNSISLILFRNWIISEQVTVAQRSLTAKGVSNFCINSAGLRCEKGP